MCKHAHALEMPQVCLIYVQRGVTMYIGRFGCDGANIAVQLF